MADEKDGSKPGGDGDAKDKAGQNTDAKTGNNSQKKDDKTEDKSGDNKQTAKTFTQDELDAIVEKRLSRERAKDKANAELTETERLKKERDDALGKAAESEIKDRFITGSKIEYAHASKLFKYYRDDIETDDKGKITNLTEILKTAKEDFPAFFPAKVAGKADGGGGSGEGKTTGDMNSMIRRRAGRE